MIFDFYRSRTDILCLQETHSTENLENLWRNEWGGGNRFFSHGTSGSRGVEILINRKFYCNCMRQQKDINRRLLKFDFIIEGENVFIVNVYGPNKDTLEFINELENLCSDAHPIKIIAGAR